MAYLLIRFCLVLPVIFTAAIGIIHAAQPDYSHLDTIFSNTACADPCFLGIELGETSLTDAHLLLASHPWIIDVADQLLIDDMGSEHLSFRWYWGDDRSDEDGWSGELIASSGTVRVVRLEIGLTLGDLWFALGKPELLTFNVVQSRNRPAVLLYNSFFSDRSVSAASSLDCPLNYQHFLQGEVYALELRRRQFVNSSIRMASNPALLMFALRKSRPLC